jgi:hypothetical protein
MKRTVLVVGGACLLAAALAVAQGQQREPDPRSRGGGDCRDNPYNCADAPNPLPPVSTVWLEEMTWMDVRDAMKAGKTTAVSGRPGAGPAPRTGSHKRRSVHNRARCSRSCVLSSPPRGADQKLAALLAWSMLAPQQRC